MIRQLLLNDVARIERAFARHYKEHVPWDQAMAELPPRLRASVEAGRPPVDDSLVANFWINRCTTAEREAIKRRVKQALGLPT